MVSCGRGGACSLECWLDVRARVCGCGEDGVTCGVGIVVGRAWARAETRRRARRRFAQGPRAAEGWREAWRPRRPQRAPQRPLGAPTRPPRRSAAACRCLVGYAPLYDHLEFHLRMAPGEPRSMPARAAGRAHRIECRPAISCMSGRPCPRAPCPPRVRASRRRARPTFEFSFFLSFFLSYRLSCLSCTRR